MPGPAKAQAGRTRPPFTSWTAPLLAYPPKHEKLGERKPVFGLALFASSMADAPFTIRPLPVSSRQLDAQESPENTRGRGNETTGSPSIVRRSFRSRSRHIRGGSSLGTVFGDSKIEGTLHWNQDIASSGLICGSSSKELLRTMMQMVKMHLQDGRGSSALIFHASSRDHLVSSSQVSTIHIAKRLPSPSIFLAPQPRRTVKELYTSIPLDPHNILPLRFNEADISLAHVLALCTPPPEYPNRERILTSVQFIVSRLAEPFSIREFNQFVDEEQWDSHGSAFMAIRQTLLTTLIASHDGDKDDVDVVSRIRHGGAIVIDLSDPVLRSTGLDSVLFDMVLCLYCSVQRDTRKLLVLDQAHEYMSTNPALLNTLVTLFSMHTDSPIKTLLSSSDLTLISPRLLSHIDYLICHDFRSPTWLNYLQQHIACSPTLPVASASANQEGSAIHNLETRQAIIISPRSISEVANGSSTQPDQNPVKWSSKAYRVEMGFDAPLTVEQRKIEQLEALVAQLSSNADNTGLAAPNVTVSHHHHHVPAPSTMGGGTVISRRSRKESSIYMENTISALRNALGYLAARKAIEGPSPSHSPPASPTLAPPVVPPHQLTPVEENTEAKTSDSDGKGSSDRPLVVKNVTSDSDPLSDGSAWKIKPLGTEFSLSIPVVQSLPDLGPFNPTTIQEPDRPTLLAALQKAVLDAGGELGVPIATHKVAEAFLQANHPIDSLLPTWQATAEYAERHGLLEVVRNDNTKHEWIVVSKPDTEEGQGSPPPPPFPVISHVDTHKAEDQETVPWPKAHDSSVVQSPDGWYEMMQESALRPQTTAPVIVTPQALPPSPFEPLLQAMSTLRDLQPFAPLLLHNVSYELKRRFPTAIRDAGYKTMVEYLYGAQAQGLVEVTDDASGSIYVQFAKHQPATAPGLAIRSPPKHISSLYSLSTDKSQPDSSAVPSSDAHLAYPKEHFGPLLTVLRSLRKHNLYKVTFTPLSLALEKMFPNAMKRLGIDNIDQYIYQARDAGLVITGDGANGKVWVSLTDAEQNGAATPTPTNTIKIKTSPSATSLHFPSPPDKSRVSDFSRLLRAIRALSAPGRERVLCSRVGMMLNKEDYKAMNVETFSQCLVAASKANLIVHGGVGGSAWVALKAPSVAGVHPSKVYEEPRSRLVKTAPPEIATNPVVPSGSAYKLPLSEEDVEPFRPLLNILRTFIHSKHIAEPFRTVVEKNLLKVKPDVLFASKCNTMDDYILRAQSYGLIAQVGYGKAARLRLLENSGLALP
ncbi:SubName: Full=Uncharacterized protein {ECO:0000313/EMBL:CCA67294.1} [Serendipita indica DSM 11827]|uniref:Uncharacterized protein n=1 Tax=Serendipita indica (strain DSM 11827) TaxID=1109443 RepID=G4T7N7_SERID|nr:SubName: Full=Uncharacterized protein {ECO:0000313/EMBL:CCA67294.1} [Serendipita indica DSM 11827]CCA67294.1 hypothetical protein PIIN_01127 [Serendipita indica DSM 11827]